MPRTAIPAAGEAMPATNLNAVVDATELIAEAHQLVAVIRLAAETAPAEYSEPITMAADIAVQRLIDARDLLNEFREQLS